MYIPFKTLVEQLGRSVQEAQDHLEKHAAEVFFQCFKTVEQSSEYWEIPLTRRIGLPSGEGEEMKVVDVPTAALLQHRSMGLDSVKVRLHLNTQMHEEHDALLVEPCSSGSEQNDVCEVELLFKAASPSEGIARLDLNLQKNL